MVFANAMRGPTRRPPPRSLGLRSDDPTHRGAAPPPVDLAGHFKELGRALLPALLVALIVAGAVFGLRTALSQKQYAASIVTQISPAQTPLPGDAFIEQMRAPFMGLARDVNVLNQVLSQVDTGWSAATLDAHVQLAPGPAPQLLIFTVTADTPELARQLAQTLVVTVAQASFANHTRDLGRQLEEVQANVTAEEATNATLAPDDPARTASDARLADLRAQLVALQNTGGDKLTVLATPQQEPGPVSPHPVSEALVAGLAALVVAAELIVLLRGRAGSRPNRTWARRMAHKYQVDFDPGAGSDVEVPQLLAAEIAHRQREGRTVLALHGKDAALPRSAALPNALVNGDRKLLCSAPLGKQWWRHLDAVDVALAVVIVRTRSADRDAAEQALRQLAGLDVPTWLVLQQPSTAKRRRGRDAGGGEPAAGREPTRHAQNGSTPAEFDRSPATAEGHVG
jgi:capsular polysaccharide biosynthesis protein